MYKRKSWPAEKEWIKKWKFVCFGGTASPSYQAFAMFRRLGEDGALQIDMKID